MSGKPWSDGENVGSMWISTRTGSFLTGRSNVFVARLWIVQCTVFGDAIVTTPFSTTGEP